MQKKTLFTLAFVCSIFILRAQCIICYDLEQALKNPSEVKMLDLSNERLTEIPNFIERFENLEELSLAYNDLCVFRQEPFKMPKLQVLNVSGNPGLDAIGLFRVFSASPLESLRLSSCNLLVLPETISDLSHLKTLRLDNNSLRSLPGSFEKLTKLEKLDLSSNKLGKYNQVIGTLWKLKTLNIAGNPDFPLEILFLNLQFKQLDELTLSTVNENQLNGEFKNLAITKINIVNSDIRILSPEMANIAGLKELCFDNSNFMKSEAIYKSLSGLGSVARISFKNQKISADIQEIRKQNAVFLSDVVVDNSVDLKGFKQLTVMNSRYEDSTRNLVSSNQNPLVEMSDNMIKNEVKPLVEVQKTAYSIPADTPCEIKTENSSFEIPKDAFLTTSGEVYTGKVKIDLTEYFDPVSLALAGAPMVMRENGTPELFSSTGMFEFMAYDDKGNKLKPNPENIIQVELKNMQPGQQTELFAYDSLKSNWNRIENQVPFVPGISTRQRILDSLNQLPDSVFARFQVNHVPFEIIYPDKNLKKRQIKKELNHIRTFKVKFYRMDNSFYGGINQDFFNKKSPVFYAGDKHLRAVNEGKLIIDTLLNPDLKELFFNVLNKTDTLSGINGSTKKYSFSPRVYSNLKIEPDYENDRFMLQFNYKGKEYAIPLLVNKKVNLKDIQASQYDFYKKYLRGLKKNEHEIEQAQERFNKNQPAIAKNIREIRATQMANRNNQAFQEISRFGLGEFGLINCDYFRRNPPENYLHFSSKAIDQDSVEVEMPATVRNIILEGNTYLETSADRVPYYGKNGSLIVVILSSIEIAVIQSWEKLADGTLRPLIKRFSIEGLNSKEVRKLILN